MRQRLVIATVGATLVVGSALGGVQAFGGALFSGRESPVALQTPPEPQRDPTTLTIDDKPDVKVTSSSKSTGENTSTSGSKSISRSYSSSLTSTTIIVNGEVVVRDIVKLQSESHSD
jgi:hypothetical protein